MMNENSVKSIVATTVKAAISNLPDKDKRKKILVNFEIKIHQAVVDEIKKVVDPLVVRIEQLELKHAFYEAHFTDWEQPLDDA